MIALDAAVRPSCVIGASVRVSVLDKSACPNGGVANDQFAKTNFAINNLNSNITCLSHLHNLMSLSLCIFVSSIFVL